MISKFTDKYAFLSNFYIHPIEYKGLIYPSSEHAYQAQKTDNEVMRLKFTSPTSPGTAKKLGQSLFLRKNWDTEKVPIMREILEIKFSDPTLRYKLQKTYPEHIVEENTWGDVFWGECPIGVGKNMLGKLLMDIRATIK